MPPCAIPVTKSAYQSITEGRQWRPSPQCTDKQPARGPHCPGRSKWHFVPRPPGPRRRSTSRQPGRRRPGASGCSEPRGPGRAPASQSVLRSSLGSPSNRLNSASVSSRRGARQSHCEGHKRTALTATVPNSTASTTGRPFPVVPGTDLVGSLPTPSRSCSSKLRRRNRRRQTRHTPRSADRPFHPKAPSSCRMPRSERLHPGLEGLCRPLADGCVEAGGRLKKKLGPRVNAMDANPSAQEREAALHPVAGDHWSPLATYAVHRMCHVCERSPAAAGKRAQGTRQTTPNL